MLRQSNASSPAEGAPSARFAGFALPTSNTTYTPNQFFDVCLPYRSRGCVRLVAYLIRKTLGWCDEHGNPQQEQHAITYREIEARAGVSRDMIHAVIIEAIAAKFIRCVDQPRRKTRGSKHHTGRYLLNWDESDEYIKDPERFSGFFAGDGNRTYIPNSFFDYVVPSETLAVIKVVGSVIRFSIGFQTKWGHRRTNVALSYQHIQNYSRLSDRKTIAVAIRRALSSNYLQRVEEGYFDPDAGRQSKPAVYALKWLTVAAAGTIGQKTPPAKIDLADRSEIPTGIGQKTPPADQSEIPTDIEIKHSNNTYKQNRSRLSGEAAVSFERLRSEGFDAKAAQAIASRHPLHVVERQINWIDRRKVKSSRLGMLRLAIEENWAAPTGQRAGELGAPNIGPRTPGADFNEAIEQARQRFVNSSSPPRS